MLDFDALQPLEQWGTIDMVPAGEFQLPASRPEGQLTVRRSRQIWRPGKKLDLPSGFELAFECEEGPDGNRRWTPIKPPRAFVLEASLAGQMILGSAGLLSLEHSYNSMRVFYSMSPHLGAFFRRKFTCRDQLLVTRAARIEAETVDILPVDLGSTPDGTGTRWSVNDVLERGREAARDANQDADDEELIIRLGLLQAARLNPLPVAEMSEQEIRSVMRMGLFDVERLSSVDAKVKAIVTERLLKAVHRHIDDPSADFREWFFEKFDNVVHQIAKQKRGGGPIGRDIVQQAILEITFDAYEYIAQSIQVVMQAFAAALPRRLNQTELEVYSLLYLKPTVLSGIPLIMLHERLLPLKEGVIDLLGSPQSTYVAGVVLQMLRYYGVMAHNSRAVDRENKRRAKLRNEEGRPALCFALNDEILASPAADHSQSEILAILIKRRKAKCRCETTEAWEVREFQIMSTEKLKISFQCSVCRHRKSIATSRSELQEIKSSVEQVA